MLRIGEVRSLIPKDVNMALTATATRSLRTSVTSILGMHDPIAGRDGRASLTLLLRKSSKGRKIDKQFMEYMNNDTQCRRDTLFQDIDIYKHRLRS